MSLDLIAPYLPPPVQEALLDPALSEIMLCAGRCFVERDGILSQRDDVQTDQRHLLIACRHIARSLQQELDTDHPTCESRLEDGSRVAIIIPPVAVDGVALTIRKFHPNWFSLKQLVELGTIEEHQATWLVQQLLDRKNILIAGSTGSGKTTLLKALADLIPPTERLMVIEETTEMPLSHLNLVRVEARHVSVRAMVSASLRHRPDRLLIGEVRGAEAFDLLQALNSGHEGSLSTIHANDATNALYKLANLAMEAGMLPYESIQRHIATLVNVVIHTSKLKGKRVVSDIVRVEGFNEHQFATRCPPPVHRSPRNQP